MQKKLIAGIIAALVIVAAVLAFINRKGDKNVSGLVLVSGGKEITVAWIDVGGQSFDGDLVNGKGEVSHHEYTGAELQALLKANGIEISESSAITATSDDNYSAELTGAELLEAGKVFVALTEGGEQSVEFFTITTSPSYLSRILKLTTSTSPGEPFIR